MIPGIDDGIDYTRIRPVDGPVGVETRRCTECGQAKPLSAFGHHRKVRQAGVKLVRKARCRACLSALETARRARKRGDSEAG